MLTIILLAICGPMALSLLATAVVRAVARRRGFIDRPGGHKQHDRPVALGGGVAIMLAVCLPLLAAGMVPALVARNGAPGWLPAMMQTHHEGIADKLPTLLAVLAGALVLHVVGLIDDLRPMGAGSKFVAQFAVALALVAGFDVRLLEFLPAPASIGLTVLWVVLITNAFNFLDNMDGLSAGVAGIAAAIFAASSLVAGQLFVPLVALVLVGALLGFLPFNFSPASIFMGDSGSMVVGYLLSVLTILTTFYDPRHDLQPFGVLVPLVVLAVPLYDVASVCWHRFRAGQSVFKGDRRHFSHRLTRRGMSVPAAVLTIYLATATTAMSALILPRSDWPVACVVLAQCMFVVLIIAVLEHAGD